MVVEEYPNLALTLPCMLQSSSEIIHFQLGWTSPEWPRGLSKYGRSRPLKGWIPCPAWILVGSILSSTTAKCVLSGALRRNPCPFSRGTSTKRQTVDFDFWDAFVRYIRMSICPKQMDPMDYFMSWLLSIRRFHALYNTIMNYQTSLVLVSHWLPWHILWADSLSYFSRSWFHVVV